MIGCLQPGATRWAAAGSGSRDAAGSEGIGIAGSGGFGAEDLLVNALE